MTDETRLRRLVTSYIVTGLFFLLLPGTFLGVWNLISISNGETLDRLSPAWVQAHGHAQIFGWIGTFILGIGFHSLSRMGRMPASAIPRGWACLVLWTTGLLLRWGAGITGWQWRILIPLASALELIAFLIFFSTVSRHRPAHNSSTPAKKPEPWMLLVMASTLGFLATLVANLALTSYSAWLGDGPALPHGPDQRVLILAAWGFLLPAVLGFNARWLPDFLGLKPAHRGGLFAALGLIWTSVFAALSGYLAVSVALMPIASAAAILALHVWDPALQPVKMRDIHPRFPVFVRGAYAWLMAASVLSVCAFSFDRHGGIWGASRHALTVGFLSTMVFSMGPRILPAFCGANALFSRRLMYASLVLLNAGCLLRVASEILAYEGIAQRAWAVLPVSAVTELTAVTLFALNLLVTLLGRRVTLVTAPAASNDRIAV